MEILELNVSQAGYLLKKMVDSHELDILSKGKTACYAKAKKKRK